MEDHGRQVDNSFSRPLPGAKPMQDKAYGAQGCEAGMSNCSAPSCGTGAVGGASYGSKAAYPADTFVPTSAVGLGGAPTRASTIPDDAAGRKRHPVASGVMDYFPDALVAVSRVSWQGNEQHNPGQPLHWARGKSGDHADALQRHFLNRGSYGPDGLRHTAQIAWRALAMLQEEIEAEQQAIQAMHDYESKMQAEANWRVSQLKKPYEVKVGGETIDTLWLTEDEYKAQLDALHHHVRMAREEDDQRKSIQVPEHVREELRRQREQ